MKRSVNLILFFFSFLLITSLCTLPCAAGWVTKWTFEEDGQPKRNEWIQDDKGKRYYLDENGCMVTGWYIADEQHWYFFDKNGYMITGLAGIGSAIYYFQEDGCVVLGEHLLDGTAYTFPVNRSLDTSLDPFVHQWFNEDGVLLNENLPFTLHAYLRRLPLALLLLYGVFLYLFGYSRTHVSLFSRKRTNAAGLWLMYAAVGLSSLPLMLPYLIQGHDLLFHLNRVLGMSEALKHGMFPVRLNAYTLNGYGYADPIFYPNLWIYIPALLVRIGLPLSTAVCVFLLLVQAATAAVMYRCSTSIFGSREIGCISSIIYTLCTYHLANLYTRSAWGELLAMVFFPVLILGFYELFFRDARRWPLLTLGITGVLQSHILSIMLVTILCVITGLALIRRVLNRERFTACVKMAVSSVLLNLWFLIPLVQYMRTDIDTSALQRPAAEYTAPVAKVLEVFSPATGVTPTSGTDISAILPTSFGLALVVGCVLFVWECWFKKKDYDKKARVLFIAGAFLAFCATELFPWRLLSHLKLFFVFASYIQFPWRFLGVAVCFLSMASAYAFLHFGGERQKTTVCAGVFVLALISSQYLINDYQRMKASIWTSKDVTSIIEQREYLYPEVDKKSLDRQFYPSRSSLVLTETARDGLTAEFTFTETGSDAVSPADTFVDVPLLFYPNYQAEDAFGRPLVITRSETGKIRVFLDELQGSVRVHFHEPRLWRLAELISLLAALWVIWECIRCLHTPRENRMLSPEEE